LDTINTSNYRRTW